MLKTLNTNLGSKRISFNGQERLRVFADRISQQDNMRAIAYSMDLLIPGLYIWFFGFTIRIGGSIPDDEPYKYPGEIHSLFGFGLVLPGYRILTSYQGSYDPKQT